MMNLRILFLLVCILCQPFGGSAQFRIPVLGHTIYEGVFTGNGLLGTMTYLAGKNSMRVDIGRTDIYDHRANSADKLFDQARMSLGHFEIEFESPIVQAQGEIHLKDAYAEAKVGTDQGMVRIRTTTLSNDNIILLEVFKKDFNGNYHLTWKPDEAISPRMGFSYTQKPKNYPTNPKGSFGAQGETKYFDQPLLAGGGYVTAYCGRSGKEVDTYLITVDYNQQGTAYVKKAINYVQNFNEQKLTKGLASHRKWWTDYFA
ncbi:MAG: hypothetical protein ACN6PI_04770, partial [Sphingobacterium siyangense]